MDKKFAAQLGLYRAGKAPLDRYVFGSLARECGYLVPGEVGFYERLNTMPLGPTATLGNRQHSGKMLSIMNLLKSSGAAKSIKAEDSRDGGSIAYYPVEDILPPSDYGLIIDDLDTSTRFPANELAAFKDLGAIPVLLHTDANIVGHNVVALRNSDGAVVFNDSESAPLQQYQNKEAPGYHEAHDYCSTWSAFETYCVLLGRADIYLALREAWTGTQTNDAAQAPLKKLFTASATLTNLVMCLSTMFSKMWQRFASGGPIPPFEWGNQLPPASPGGVSFVPMADEVYADVLSVARSRLNAAVGVLATSTPPPEAWTLDSLVDWLKGGIGNYCDNTDVFRQALSVPLHKTRYTLPAPPIGYASSRVRGLLGVYSLKQSWASFPIVIGALMRDSAHAGPLQACGEIIRGFVQNKPDTAGSYPTLADVGIVLNCLRTLKLYRDYRKVYKIVVDALSPEQQARLDKSIVF
jgi:hypothetical protein